jgi:hypothetical protein
VHINEAGQIDCPDENTLLVGLHACGDLSSLIIKNFVASPNSKSLINFGCCYHKLNGGSDKLFMEGKSEPTVTTFPMSQQYKEVKLSYAARELACHANEQFLEQLRSKTTVCINVKPCNLQFFRTLICSKVPTVLSWSG